jgi:hypothetical protein
MSTCTIEIFRPGIARASTVRPGSPTYNREIHSNSSRSVLLNRSATSAHRFGHAPFLFIHEGLSNAEKKPISIGKENMMQELTKFFVLSCCAVLPDRVD